MDISQLYAQFLASDGITIDSRNIKPSQLFFALKGEKFDGNQFAQFALESGAKLAVVDDPSLQHKQGMFYVPNTLSALQELAKYHRKKLSCQVIAITGSNGKTTTKELLKSVLSTQFLVQATEGNLNNHLGVPLTILKARETTKILIVEMGANHIGEIAGLCHIADPDFGIITNIGKAHLEGFGSLDGVIKAKSELFQYVCQKGGTIFYNVKERNINPDDFKGCTHVPFDPTTMDIIAEFPHLHCSYQGQLVITQMYGRYNLANVSLAFAIGKHFGINTYNILAGIEEYKPQNNRSQVVAVGSNTVIMDAYNANPSSMEIAVRDFGDVVHAKKITILGDMLELGSYSHNEHHAILSLVATKNFYKSIFVGEHFYGLRDQFPFEFYQDIDTAMKMVEINNYSDCLILLKGSRKIALEKFIQ